MARTLAISDIHGCVNEFNQLLDLIQYKAGEDTLLLLGDYVDRGPASRETVDRVMQLVREEGAIALKGNHDQRFVEVVAGEVDAITEMKFLEYGGVQTFRSYCESEPIDMDQSRALIKRSYGHHIDFLDSLPLYAEDDRHIYVHAGLNPAYSDWKNQPKRDFTWIRDPFIYQPTAVDKKVVFGHSPTRDIQGKPDIWFGHDKIGIDGSCAYGYQLNCLEIQDGNDYHSHFIASQSTWQHVKRS